MEEKVISEILGGIAHGSSNQPIQQQQQPIDPSAPPGSFYNPSLDSSVGVLLNPAATRMYGWQQDIVNELKQHDMFIITRSPGGGKTLPVFVYWADELLGLNTRLLYPENRNIARIQISVIEQAKNIFIKPETLPKILWCTPFRALNDQTITQEFEKSFLQIYMQIVNITQTMVYEDFDNPDKLLFPPANQFLYNFIKEIENNMKVQNLYNFIEQLRNQFRLAPDQAAKNHIAVQINERNKELFAEYEQVIKRRIKQRIVGNEYENEHTGIDPQTGKPKPVVVSIYESAGNIINRYYPGTLKLIVFDEIQRVHLSESFDKSQDQRARQIAGAIHTILKSKTARAKEARLVLLSGTENKSAADALTFFYNVAYNRTFPVNTEVIDAGNIANISVRPLDSLRNDENVVRIIKQAIAGHDIGTVFLLFNKQKIRDLAEKCSTSSSNQDVFRRQQSNIGAQSKRYYQMSDVSAVSGHGDASRIVNPLLRRAIASGLGFTYSLKPDDVGYYPQIQQDNQIVQELFKSGKIYVLLATDNIEAGMNINIKTLYIPKFEKMKQQIPLASRSQILNRVGRQPMDCTIYTPSEYVADVEEALNAVNSDFAATPPIMSPAARARYMNKLVDKIVADPIIMVAKALKRLWT